MKKRLSTWRKKHLSFAGRIALINSVLSALPTFYMAIFIVPKGVVKEIDKIRRRFLWGGANERTFWAKVKWEEVCRPKRNGGLGIANLEARNKALLCKWWWRYAKEPDSLWRRVIVAVYGEEVQSWRSDSRKITSASKIWGPILKLNSEEDTNKIIGSEGFKWLIGNERNVLFWWDKWADRRPLKEDFPRLFSLARKKLLSVEEACRIRDSGGELAMGLFRRNLRAWEEEEVRLLEVQLNQISLNSEKEDIIVWIGNADGVFTTKQATKMLLEQEQANNRFQFDYMWKISVPAKVQSFLWLIVLGRIPSKQMLISRKIIPATADISCSICGHHEEDMNHLMLLCPVVRTVWKDFLEWWKIDKTVPNNFTIFFGFLFGTGSNRGLVKRWRLAVGAALWTIWSARNEATFNGKKWSRGEIVFTIKLRSWHWSKALLSKEDHEDEGWWINPNVDESGVDLSRQPHPKWTPPEDDWLKFNTDASVCMRRREAGIGGVLRDSQEKILAMFANPWKFEEVDKVETEAIRFALSKASMMKHQMGGKIIIESDSMVAVSWCLTPVSRPIMYADVFQDIDKHVWSFEAVIIQHVAREMNGLANSLAKMGKDRRTALYLSWPKV